ncbi:hypothetical protein MNBD_GAMMA14-1960 [hydrothermal vent metagenome]|uniref:Uncharacterized protein n=1 Tax=hydrothermal vent metagenome TaxID=652676 RepID=A0A3B0YQA8_9ZZZZ
MSEINSCVAIYDLHRNLEDSLGALRSQGSDLQNVSVVGKGGYSRRDPFAFVASAGRVRFHGEQGEFWNRVYKVLGSAGCYWIHGYGPFAVAGLMVNVLSARPDQQVITGPLRKLGMAFYAIGVSGDSALRYETVVGQGRLLLIVQGGRDEVELASETIATTESVEMAVHAA